MRAKPWILVAPLLAALVTACAGSDALSVDAVAEAATKTTDARSSRLTFVTSFSGGGQSFQLRGDGELDYRRNLGRMTTDLSDMARLGAGNDALRNAKIEMIFDGLIYYVKLPAALMSELGTSKRWIKIDVAKLGRSAGVDVGALARIEQNPTQLMQYLRAVGDDIERIGEDEVRGTETTHFRASIEFAKAAEFTAERGKLSPEVRAQLRKGLDQLKRQSGLDRIPVDVWLDADGLLRKMVMDVDMNAGGERSNMRMTMELFDFGIDVNVQTPPARQVVDVTKFALGQG